MENHGAAAGILKHRRPSFLLFEADSLPSPGGYKYMFPLSTNRVTGIVDGSY